MKKNKMNMLKTTFMIILLLFFACVSTPQNIFLNSMTDILDNSGNIVYSFETNQPDKYIKELPYGIRKLQKEDSEEFIRQLVEYINIYSLSDFDKIKKVHDWIALNIKYDMNSLIPGKRADQDYENVLKTGLAVCEGYSRLFIKFCEELDIDSDYVSGYAVNKVSVFDEIDSDNLGGHAWNIVEIYDNWYLIDITWNSGFSMTWDTGGLAYKSHFIFKYKTDYLFINPEKMIYDHFPFDEEFQLLDEPYTEDEFFSFPKYYRTFNDFIYEVKPNLNNITEIEELLEIEFILKQNTFLYFEILNEDGVQLKNLNSTWVNGITYKENDIYRTLFNFPNAGKYIIRVSANKNQSDYPQNIIEYGIILTKKIVLGEKEYQKIGYYLQKQYEPYKIGE
jgi:hypothetical protein